LSAQTLRTQGCARKRSGNVDEYIRVHTRGTSQYTISVAVAQDGVNGARANRATVNDAHLLARLARKQVLQRVADQAAHLADVARRRRLDHADGRPHRLV